MIEPFGVKASVKRLFRPVTGIRVAGTVPKNGGGGLCYLRSVRGEEFDFANLEIVALRLVAFVAVVLVGVRVCRTNQSGSCDARRVKLVSVQVDRAGDVGDAFGAPVGVLGKNNIFRYVRFA